jgi:hypothetical protein
MEKRLSGSSVIRPAAAAGTWVVGNLNSQRTLSLKTSTAPTNALESGEPVGNRVAAAHV